MTKKKFFLWLVVLAIITVPVGLYLSNRLINDNASGKLYTDTAAIPFNKVGILLGTSKYITPQYINPYYAYRIQATTKLLKSGKIKYIVVSGDNSRKDYNEPQQMQQDLMAAGIDSSVIFLDYAGFRTFDSMVRLEKIFGQTSVTVISQQFHNERAIYIAGKYGISAIGFNATDVPDAQGFKTQLRERFARVKMFLDFWFDAKPKFLGEKVVIPD